MKIFLICSKVFYDKVPCINEVLVKSGYVISLPNCIDNPFEEDKVRKMGGDSHSKWKAEMFDKSLKTVDSIDAVLVLNFDKNGVKNYIGGATFLEMYDAFRAGKRIYMYNEIPEGILYDEIVGFKPVIVSGDLSLIK